MCIFGYRLGIGWTSRRRFLNSAARPHNVSTAVRVTLRTGLTCSQQLTAASAMTPANVASQPAYPLLLSPPPPPPPLCWAEWFFSVTTPSLVGRHSSLLCCPIFFFRVTQIAAECFFLPMSRILRVLFLVLMLLTKRHIKLTSVLYSVN